MKKILTTLILFVTLYQSYGQTVTYDDFKSLIPFLQAEDWKSAFNQSAKILKGTENDSSDYKAIVLYINIYTAAGMVSVGDMTYDDLAKNVMKYKGQKIIMSAHPVSDSETKTINKTHLTVNDSTNEAFTSASNGKGTSIFCFEKIKVKDKIDLSEFPANSFARCGGTLEKIETNPNKSTIWILRLTVVDAFIRKPN
ncbi:MAG: hypothetical protein ABI723_24680 [Bacteroidia bacterium]